MAAVNVYTDSSEDSASEPHKLKQRILYDLKTPVIFKNRIKPWFTKMNWSIEEICQILGETTSSFKVCPKAVPSDKVLFETDCDHIDMSFKDMSKWIHSDEDGDSTEVPSAKRLKHNDPSTSVDLSSLYPRSEYWVYADYKYMCQLCADHQDLIQCIDWSVFGFDGRNGNQSTLWVGSEGASTPCHYDTYGCNLVAQLSGTKQWTLFPPSDTNYLYPTRVPYEESSVFSSVSINDPQIQKYPLYKNANPHKVTLTAGDVLFVPFHWWHYVECLEPSVSVNTWIDLPIDNMERIKEAVVRILVSALVTNEKDMQVMINPNEAIFSNHENLTLLNTVLQQQGLSPSLTNQDLINIFTNQKVLKTIQDVILYKTNT